MAPGLGYDVDGGDGLAVGGQHPGLLLLRHHQVVAGGSLQLLHWALGLLGHLLATTILLIQLYTERCKDIQLYRAKLGGDVGMSAIFLRRDIASKN